MVSLNAPLFYSFELVSQCNNNCFVCSNSFVKYEASQQFSDWSKILHSISPYIEVLKLTGGEPTLHPQIADIILFLAKKNIKFTLFTNGRWSNPQAIIDLFRSTPQCGGLLISLHGPDAKTHEAFTNTPGSFEETCENIQRASRSGLRVHTSTVLTCQNYNSIHEIVALSEGLGAKCAVFNRYIGPHLPEVEPMKWQIRRAIQDIENIKNSEFLNSKFKIKYGNCFPQCFMPSSSTGCWAGIAYCTIDPWGNLRPCNHSPTIVGNILEEPIEKIWNNEIMNKWRSLLPEQCKNCTELEICHGGCRAQAELLNMKQDPLIGKPIDKNHINAPMTLDLYENSYPLLQCTVRTEPFGYALVSGNSLLPVRPEAKNILDILKGQKTLRQIQKDHGQEVLDFIGSLYLNGLLKLEDQPIIN